MVGTVAFISKFIDYQFKIIAVNTYPDQNQLADFWHLLYEHWYSYSNYAIFCIWTVAHQIWYCCVPWNLTTIFRNWVDELSYLWNIAAFSFQNSQIRFFDFQPIQLLQKFYGFLYQKQKNRHLNLY